MKILRSVYFNFSNTSRSGKTAGFIGLGNMGGPMALNLQKNGYKVFGYDGNEATRKTYQDKGLKIVNELSQMTKETDTIVTMLPNHTIVESVCFGNNGLFSLLPKKGIIIDCSTISPQAALNLHQEAKKHNINFVDSPVSGGVVAATAGTLTFMVGSSEIERFEKAKNILQHMGKNVINTEKDGAGQIAKTCNNMALAIEMIAVSEALALGKKLGIDSKVLTKIMNISSGSCWSSLVYNPVPGVLETAPSSNNYEGGFACELMLKDLTIATSSAKSVDASVKFGQLSKEIYEVLIEQGKNRKDFSYVYDQIYSNKLK